MTTAPDGGPANSRAGRDSQVLDLAADVRRVRDDVNRLRETMGDLASTVSEFGPQLLDVQRDLNGVRGLVDELTAATETTQTPPADWFTMTADAAQQEWVALGDWVHHVLAGWYQIARAQLPDCWALHRPAFLQVAWLHTSHTQAYLPASHPNQAAEWNTRWLDAALEKVRRHIPESRCRAVTGGPGEHLVDHLDTAQQTGRAGGPGLPYPPASEVSPYPNPYEQQYAPRPQSELRSPDWAEQEVIRADYWGGYFTQAMQTDLAWRRDRDEQLAAQDTETGQPPGGDASPH
ncbi:hypothetical protein ACFPM0_37395 [Pseudonocardia sulfidoxydans]|uniref:hypothetical protein n=5 Tax=Pseudonocardia sulfidoxydans TaxID=54011 RepID=UPI003623CD23